MEKKKKKKMSIKGFHTSLVKNKNFKDIVTAHAQSFRDVPTLL